MKVNVKDDIPFLLWKNKKCSKPPTSIWFSQWNSHKHCIKTVPESRLSHSVGRDWIPMVSGVKIKPFKAALHTPVLVLLPRYPGRVTTCAAHCSHFFWPQFSYKLTPGFASKRIHVTYQSNRTLIYNQSWSICTAGFNPKAKFQGDRPAPPVVQYQRGKLQQWQSPVFVPGLKPIPISFDLNPPNGWRFWSLNNNIPFFCFVRLKVLKNQCYHPHNH